MSWRALWPFGVIAVAVLFPTWKFLFGGQVPAPVEDIHALAPWSGESVSRPFDVLQADAALQFLPWRDLMLSSMRSGEMPLWNPYTLSGIPFLANSQSAPVYPLHWLLVLTGISAEWLICISAYVHLLIAGSGTYLLCRKLGGSEVGGLIGGTGLCLSAFFVGWLELPSVVMSAAWIPWCLFAVVAVHEEPGAKSAAKLATPVGLMLLGGHLQIALYGLAATVAYGVWLSVFSFRNAGGRKERMRGVAVSVLGILLGVMLAAPQLLPSLENGALGHRAQPPTVEGYEAYSRQALGLHHLAVLAAPMIFGMPGDLDSYTESMSGYWLAYTEPGRHYAELALWVGPVVFPLALLGFFAKRGRSEVSFFMFLALLSLAIALGTVVTQAMYFWIPGWAATGSPGRAAILFALSLCVLAGAAVSGRKSDLSRLGVWLILAFVLAIYIFVAVWATMLRDGPQLTSSRQTLYFLLVPVVGALIAGAVFSKGRLSRAAACSTLVLSVATLAFVHRNLNPGSERGVYNKTFNALEYLRTLGFSKVAVVNDQWSLMGPGPKTVAPPNSLLPYRIHEVAGYDSIVPRVRKEKLDRINNQDSAPAANGNMLFVKPTFDPELLCEAGAEVVMAAYDLPLEVVASFGLWTLYALPPSSRPSVRVEQETMNTKVVSVPPGLGAVIELDEGQLPGWLMREDGRSWKPLTGFMANPFGPEGGRIELVYRPTSYSLGMLLGMLGLSVTVALSLMNRK